MSEAEISSPSSSGIALKFAVGTCWVLAVLLFIWNLLILPYRVHGVDYGKHWIAAGRVMAGQSPYEGELFLSFNYPMLVAFLYAPLAFFSEETGARVFDALNFLMMVGAAMCVVLGLRPRALPDRRWLTLFWGPLVVFLFASSNSIRRLVWSGNVDGLNVLLLCCFITLLVRGKDRWAGVVLGLVTLVKVAPILFLVPLVALRKWRVLAFFAVVLACYWSLLMVSGWATVEVKLYREVLPGIPWFWRHISLSFHNALVYHLIGWGNLTEDAYRKLVLGLNAVMMTGLCALVYTRWSRVKNSPALVMTLSYQWLIAFLPLLEMIHVAWTLPALFVGLREWAEGRTKTSLVLLWAASWGLLVNIDTVGTTIAYAFHRGDLSHLVMTGLVALSLIAVTVYTLSPEREEPTA